MADDSDMRDEFAIFTTHREFHPEFGEIPKTKGVPRSLVLAVTIGIIMIFLIGAGAALTSHYGHHWPWTKNFTIPLK